MEHCLVPGMLEALAPHKVREDGLQVGSLDVPGFSVKLSLFGRRTNAKGRPGLFYQGAPHVLFVLDK